MGYNGPGPKKASMVGGPLDGRKHHRPVGSDAARNSVVWRDRERNTFHKYNWDGEIWRYWGAHKGGWCGPKG